MSRASTLAAVAPEIAAEWHKAKNAPLRPEDVAASSRQRVYWRCPTSARHAAWLAAVNIRARGGKGCPECVREARERARSRPGKKPVTYTPREGVCGVCHLKKNDVRGNRELGVDICSNCYKRGLQPRAKCSGCGQDRIVTMRLDHGRPLCNECYKREVLQERCSRCREIRTVHQRDEAGKPVCPTCYRAALQEVCGICGELGVVNARGEGDEAICRRCYARELQPRERCVLCDRVLPVAMRLDRGPVCGGCYEKDVAPRRVCSRCGERAQVKTWRAGAPLCAACAM